VSQQTFLPNRKVAASATVGLPAGVLAAWVLELVLGEPVPAEVAAAIGTLCSFAAAYLTRERA
jgi:putative flippase GtrA